MKALVFNPQPAGESALQLALRYAHEAGMSDNDLYNTYGLHRATLRRISRGASTNSSFRYFCHLCLALNDKRLKLANSGHEAEALNLSLKLRDLLLVFAAENSK